MLNKSTMYDIEMYEHIVISICQSYKKLYDLEIQGLKETLDYKKELSDLQSSLALENNLLEKFKSSSEFEQIIYFMEEKYNINVGIDLNFSFELENIIKTRISNGLNGARISLLKDYRGSFPGALFVSGVYQDIFRLALSIYSDSQIAKKSDKVKAKYLTSISMKDIEKEFISSNFEIEKEPYMTFGLLRVGDDAKKVSEAIIDCEAGNLITYFLEIIANLDNNVYYDESLFYESTFGSAIFRSSLALASPELTVALKDRCAFLLSLLKQEVSAKIAYDLLYESLNNRENDLNIPKFISLGR